MKNIKIRKLEKYDSEDYQEIGFGVYLNKKANNYCFSYETTLEDGEDQYPLEDLLDKYSVSCKEFYGDEVVVDGEKVSYVQVVTLNASLESLISILNYATIVGREIQNIDVKEYCLLAKRYGMGKVKLNGTEYEIPILANRSENRNLNNFEIKYPEVNYERMFKEVVEMPEELADYEPKFIFLENGVAKVVCETTKWTPEEYYEEFDKIISTTQKSFVFNLKGFIRMEE